MNSYNQYERELAHKAGMYELLAGYYKYIDPQKHMMYYMKHFECMQQLIQLQQQQQMGHAQYRNNQQQSYVRVFHASPNAPNVDIYVNGQLLLQDVAYKQVSDYIPVMPGDYRIKITATGQQEAVLTKDVNVPPNSAITLAAAGKVEKLKLLPYQDDLYPEQGKAKVRFIHLSPDAPRVDIAVKGGDILFSNVGFNEATQYKSIPPTKVDLEVRPAGSKQVVLVIPDVMLNENQIYNAVAVGFVESEPSLEAMFI